MSRLNMVSLSFLLFLALGVPSSGIGSDANGKYASYGPGGISCSKFVELVRDRQDISYADSTYWVSGYLTAVNMYTTNSNVLGTTDFGGAMLWIEKYCHNNPLELFSVAVHALVKALYPTGTTEAPK